MIDEHDEMIDRIAGVLRPLPQVDDAARARVLVAVAAERERDREESLRRNLMRRGGRVRWLVAVAGVAAAAMVAAVILRTPQRTNMAITPAAAAQTDARLIARDAAAEADVAREPVQLVLRAPSATSVRVVGDFNAWDKEQAPMTRDAASGLWSVTLSLRPGRHVYAFVVNDTVWMRDPRATAAPDADFGRPGSVLLVGRP
ncbi:MAG: hypothetical protein JWL61_2537 [Gemmatimonadetes bacterium]|nr:hypothetical protein [Gemmatimonadota bacterium]